MIIDFLAYAEMKKAQAAAAELARQADLNRRARLEWVLCDLLADIQAA